MEEALKKAEDVVLEAIRRGNTKKQEKWCSGMCSSLF
jgi:hypothetical protein